jgi:uncharacterized protein (TIGR02145 family)
MVENLKTTRYNDGTDIPNVTDLTTWSNLTTPGYCWFNNDEAMNKATYGALYNWYTINTGKLCPPGWHVPTDVEWKTLTTYIGGESVAGGKLKETGTDHWMNPNIGATNETGFSALPGGYNAGSFYSRLKWGLWWSSTEMDKYLWIRIIEYNKNLIIRTIYPKTDGLSVRCIKD